MLIAAIAGMSCLRSTFMRRTIRACYPFAAKRFRGRSCNCRIVQVETLGAFFERRGLDPAPPRLFRLLRRELRQSSHVLRACLRPVGGPLSFGCGSGRALCPPACQERQSSNARRRCQCRPTVAPVTGVARACRIGATMPKRSKAAQARRSLGCTVTTSPGAVTVSSARRSGRVSVVFSRQILVQLSRRNRSTCASTACPTVLTRAWPGAAELGLGSVISYENVIP